MQIEWVEPKENKENKLFTDALKHFQKEYGEGPFNVESAILINACLADAKAKDEERAKFIIIEIPETVNGPAIRAEFFKNPPLTEGEIEENKTFF